MDFELIDSPAEIPTGIRYILLMRGSENRQTRHSRGITIVVEGYQGDMVDNLRQMVFFNELDYAKWLARQEGITRMFVVRDLPVS
jgi:hypothetical protein